MTRSIRFRYNPVFLPEYLSTILISLPISALFAATPMGGGRAAAGANIHSSIAMGLYLAIACWLMLLTALYRRRCCPIIFFSNGQNAVWIESGQAEIALRDIIEVKLSLGKFFGRWVRRIQIEDERGNAVALCDAIFGYDHVRGLLTELLGGAISRFPEDEPKRVEKVKTLWAERHAMFPVPETLGDVFSRLSWRAVCLLPVAVVDVLINVVTIFSLGKFQKHALMAYSAPLSLLVSGFIARYLYYYMFTSTMMNKER